MRPFFDMADKMRRISVSPEERARMLQSGAKFRFIESFYPIDRFDCECVPIKQDWVTKLALLPPNKKRAEMSKVKKITCPRAKRDGFKKYVVICKRCRAKLAFVYSKDRKLTDFCDLHYLTQHDGQFWSGCMAVNVSQNDGLVGFECTCGVKTTPNNAEGKAFGTKSSKFILRRVRR